MRLFYRGWIPEILIINCFFSILHKNNGIQVVAFTHDLRLYTQKVHMKGILMDINSRYFLSAYLDLGLVLA